MLFNEPKLLKFALSELFRTERSSFSALQRAEIAEIVAWSLEPPTYASRFSALQRAEIAEIVPYARALPTNPRFSALQRAEIAEMVPLSR